MDNDVTLPDTRGPSRFAPGQLIAGRFAVVRYIDRGGMGEVYEVEDRFLQNVHVALKMIAPEIAGDASSSRRFEQEVLLARKVTHPNLCPIYDIARVSDPPPPFLFLTMKLLAGQTLSARLEEAGLIPPAEAISIFCQLAAGLTALHTAGIIHRDIKPNNVMLDRSGPELCVCIMDFGLARLHQDDATIGSIGGTPGYMAPEIFTEGPSQAADLFALGVLMHRVLAGERPRYGEINHTTEPTAALDQAKVPPIFIHTVKEFLSSDSRCRCAAFEEFQAVAVARGSSGSRQLAAAHSPSHPHLLTRRRFALASAAAAAGVAGGIAFEWDRLDDLFHPLPQKRFVALVGWPVAAEDQLKATISSVVDAIGSELSRAEAFDHDLLVIPHNVSEEVATIAQLNELRESVGANLVLAASGSLQPKGFRLLLHLFDPLDGSTLRAKSLLVPHEAQLELPAMAVKTAAKVLNITRYKPDDQRTRVGTVNREAYAAFQAAESFRDQDNDAGLDRAIDKYQDAIKLDPGYADAQSRLAWAYLRVYGLRRDPGALGLASLNFKSAIQYDPGLAEAHTGLASYFHQTGNPEESVREMAKSLALDPTNVHALTYQANFYADDNRWDEAEASFKRITSLRPNYWLAHNEYGAVLEDQGKYPEALVEFRQASILLPRDARPLKSVGTVYLRLGRISEALENLNASYQIDPGHKAAITLAEAFRLQQKYLEALDYAHRAIKLNPHEPSYWLELGDIYSEIVKNRTDAPAAYGRAALAQEDKLRTSPKSGPGWMTLALCRAKAELFEPALALVAKAETMFADDMDSQIAKVRTLELAGRREESLAAMQRCLKRGPTLFQFENIKDLEKLRTSLEFKSMLASTATANI